MSFERAAAILEGVQRAPALGVAAPIAADDLAAPDGREVVGQSRLRAARSWLFALGYLTTDTDSASYDAALVAAVKAFQREAGLVADGWLGADETWPRLQELVAFEHALEPGFWAVGGVPKPALVRAVAIRLRLYGFDAPLTAGAAFERALARFEAVLASLGARGGGLALTEGARLAAALDHDRHLAAIAGAAGTPEMRAVLAGDDGDPDAVAGVGLLLNMAKIELWLAQGAEATLGEVYRARRGLDGLWVLPSAIRGDMKAYMGWIDEDVPGADGMRRAYRQALRRGAPGQALLVFLDAARRFGVAQDPFAPERIAQLHAFYGGAGDRVPLRARTTVQRLTEPRSLRARLWDGLGRIWSWLSRALRKALQTGRRVLRLARDIASYAFSAATEGLGHVTRAVGAFLAHVRTATRRCHVEPRGLAVVARDFGRDVSLAARTGAPPAEVARFAQTLCLSAQILRRASNILGRAIGLGISVAGMAIAAPLVLRTLIGAIRDIGDVLRLGRELVDLLARYDRLTQTQAP